MYSFLSVLFTAVLVIDCLLLILLVLVQLPKKEAGAGMAFGGAATDALFGAGSGNVLTKITKYATIVFFVLTLLLAVVNAQRKGGSGSSLKDEFGSGKPVAPATAPLATSISNTAPGSVLTTTSAAPSSAPAPVVPATNAPAK